MGSATRPLRLAQISDIHCGESSFDPGVMGSIVEHVNGMQPDAVLVVGDLTAKGYQWEFVGSRRRRRFGSSSGRRRAGSSPARYVRPL